MTEVATAATVVSILGTAFFQEKAMEKEKKATKRANALAKEQTEIERAAQEAALKEEQRRNRNLLAQQQSAYKAKLGASGLTTSSGSGQVVLDAMAKESDMEDKYQTQKTNYSLRTLNNRLKQTNTRNLLALDKLRINQKQNVLNTVGALGKMGNGGASTPGD